MEEAKQDAGGLSPVHDSQGSTGEGTGHRAAPQHRAQGTAQSSTGEGTGHSTTAQGTRQYWAGHSTTAQGSTGATLEHPHHCPDPETLLERLQTKDLHTDGRVAESSIWLHVKCETLDFKLLGDMVHRDG